MRQSQCYLLNKTLNRQPIELYFILNRTGKKISKRDPQFQDQFTVKGLRERGILPSAVLQWILSSGVNSRLSSDVSEKLVGKSDDKTTFTFSKASTLVDFIKEVCLLLSYVHVY